MTLVHLPLCIQYRNVLHIRFPLLSYMGMVLCFAALWADGAPLLQNYKSSKFIFTNHWTLCNTYGTPSMVLLFHQGINDERNYCDPPRVVNFNFLVTILVLSNTSLSHVRRLLKTIILFFWLVYFWIRFIQQAWSLR